MDATLNFFFQKLSDRLFILESKLEAIRQIKIAR